MCNCVHKKRHTLKKNSDWGGPDCRLQTERRSSQEAGAWLHSASCRRAAGWFLPPLASTDKTLLPINQRLYSTADGRSEAFIYCPLQVQGSIRDCGGSGAPRSLLSFLCFFTRIMPHAERVRERDRRSEERWLCRTCWEQCGAVLFYRLL